MKRKIREVFNLLSQKTGKTYQYSDYAKMLMNTTKKPKAGTIQSRVNDDGYLTDEEVAAIEKHENVILYNRKQTEKLDNVNSEDCVKIPVRGNLFASLGQGIEIVDETQTATYSISRRLMKDVGANLNDTDFIPCEGDSMEPTIEGGALLMVDRTKTEVFDGKIYCVRLNGNLIAKRLQFIPPNSVKVISDNKDKYDPFYVDLAKTLDYDFAIIGEVKWYGTVVK